MKRFVCLVALSLILGGSATALQWGVKAGGGVITDPNRWGGHASLDIPVSEEYPTSLTAFFEYHRKSGVDFIPTGLAITYKAPLSRAGGTIFFSGGGGLLRSSGSVSDPLTGTVVSGSSNDGMITVAGGAIVNMTEAVGVFGQFRWFKRFASGAQNQYSIHVGLHFPLGDE